MDTWVIWGWLGFSEFSLGLGAENFPDFLMLRLKCGKRMWGKHLLPHGDYWILGSFLWGPFKVAWKPSLKLLSILGLLRGLLAVDIGLPLVV